MIQEIKKKFVAFLRELGYQIGDNSNSRDGFPQMNIRFNGGSTDNTRDLERLNVIFTIDIFSDYVGEKEIIEIVENINNHLAELRDANDEIINVNMSSFNIMEDKTTGPILKHGVISYRLLLIQGVE